MKYLLTFLLLIGIAKAQSCYEPGNAVAVTAHYIIHPNGNGVGLSLGHIGVESIFSFSLTGEYVWRYGEKEAGDSTQMSLGAQFMFRFKRTERVYYQVVLHPAMIGVDADLGLGLRAMFAASNRVAFAVQPEYYIATRTKQLNFLTILIF